MKRRLPNLLALVSLLLCVAVAGLWVHSGFRQLWCGHGGSRDASGVTRQWAVGSRNGRICWMLVWHWATSSPEPAGTYVRSLPTQPVAWPWRPAATPTGYAAAGFYFDRTRGPAMAWDRRSVAVPDWFLIALFAVLPAVRWLERKPAPGLCPRCAYDLRATPGRCPECGHCSGDSTPVTSPVQVN